MVRKQHPRQRFGLLVKLAKKSYLPFLLAWKVIRWPFRHRRLPNRTEFKRFIDNAQAAIIGRLKKPETPITLEKIYQLWRGENCPASLNDELGLPSSLPTRTIPSRRNFRVLYVVKAGVWDAATLRYRAYNLIEALKTQGIEAVPTDELHLPASIPDLLGYDLIVLARREWGSGISQLALSASDAGIPVIADFDDYIFDEEVIPFLAAKQTFNTFEIKKFMITPYRAAVENTGYFTGSLEYLCDKARHLGKTAFAIPNGMNFSQIHLSELAARERQVRNINTTTVTLGYFSGSRTHQDDFRVIYGAILRLMKLESKVHLFICGDFDVSEFAELSQFEGRIHQEGFVDWRMLPALIARSDIQLVPLEENVFTRAKSQLKYYEAGICGIPTVASPIPSFAGSIKQGITGFLATTEEEWFSCLKKLVNDPELRQEIGSNARVDALAHFSPEVIGRRAAAVYQEILRDYRSRSADRSNPVVILRISDPETALATRNPVPGMIKPFSQLGMTTIVSVPRGTNLQSIEKMKASSMMGSNTQVIPGNDIRCCDLLIAGDTAAFDILNRYSYRAQSSAFLVVDQSVCLADLQEEVHCFNLGNSQITETAKGEPGKIHSVESWAEDLPIPEFRIAAIPEATLLIVLSELSQNTIGAIRHSIAIFQERNPCIPFYGAGLIQSFIDDVTTGVSDLYSDQFYSLFMKSPVCVIAGANADHPLFKGLQKLGYPVLLVESEILNPLLDATPGLISAQPDELEIYNRIESLHLDRVLLSRLSIEGRENTESSSDNAMLAAIRILEIVGLTVTQDQNEKKVA